MTFAGFDLKGQIFNSNPKVVRKCLIASILPISRGDDSTLLSLANVDHTIHSGKCALFSVGNPYKGTSIQFASFDPLSTFSMVMQEVGRRRLNFLLFISSNYLKNRLFYKKSLITSVSHQMVKLTVEPGKKLSHKLIEQYSPTAFSCCSSLKFAIWPQFVKSENKSALRRLIFILTSSKLKSCS